MTLKDKIAKLCMDGVCSGDSSWDEIADEILKLFKYMPANVVPVIIKKYGYLPNSYWADLWEDMIKVAQEIELDK